MDDHERDDEEGRPDDNGRPDDDGRPDDGGRSDDDGRPDDGGRPDERRREGFGGNDDDRSRATDADAGLFGALRQLLEALADAEEVGRTDASGRRSNGHFTTEYSISGQVGLPGSGRSGESASPSGTRPGSRSDSSGGSDESSGVGPDEPTRADESYRVDARYDDDGDELLVVADLPAVDVDDLTAGLDRERDELVIGVEGRPVERIELPWPVADVESGFRHGVLELRLTSREADE